LNGSGTGEFIAAGTIAFQASQKGNRIRYRFTPKKDTTPLYQFITPYYDGGLPGETKALQTFALSGDTFNANGNDATPVISTWVTRAVLRVDPLRTIWMVARLSDHIADMEGKDEKLPLVTLKANIDALFTADNYITMYDLFGATRYVHAVPGGRGVHDLTVTTGTNKERKLDGKYELLFYEARTS